MTQQLTLSRPQKAAAILVAMGKPAASKLLKFFKQEELRTLVEGARQMRTIPQAELEKIVAEFEAEFAEGAGLLDSGDQIDTLLTESLSEEEMTALMASEEEVVVQDVAPPIWPELEKLDPARLAAIVGVEHPQTVALILSQIAPSAAAKVVVLLEKSLRGDVVKRMLSLAPVSHAAKAMVEGQLRARLAAETNTKDDSAGTKRVANLLNELDRGDLDEVMADLEEAGSTAIDKLRAQLFSFEDIVLLTQKARVSLFDGLPTDQVTNALRIGARLRFRQRLGGRDQPGPQVDRICRHPHGAGRGIRAAAAAGSGLTDMRGFVAFHADGASGARPAVG
jgi:flagellar motor switch protein FliG